MSLNLSYNEKRPISNSYLTNDTDGWINTPVKTNTERIRIVLELALVILVTSLGIIFKSQTLIILGLPLAILTIYIINKINKEGWKNMGFRKPNNWIKTIAITISIAVIIQFTSGYVLKILTSLGVDGLILNQYNPIKGSIPNLVLYLIISWTTAGFGEEIIWRGFILKKTSKIFTNPKVGWTVGVIFSASLFGIAHLQQGMTGVLITAILAVIFSLIYIRTKNLWWCILIHGFMDSIAFIALYFGFSL